MEFTLMFWVFKVGIYNTWLVLNKPSKFKIRPVLHFQIVFHYRSDFWTKDTKVDTLFYTKLLKINNIVRNRFFINGQSFFTKISHHTGNSFIQSPNPLLTLSQKKKKNKKYESDMRLQVGYFRNLKIMIRKTTHISCSKT